MENTEVHMPVFILASHNFKNKKKRWFARARQEAPRRGSRNMSIDTSVQGIRMLGTPVDILSMESLLTIMERWIHERDRAHWIACTNHHGLMEALRDSSFRQVLESADLNIPDGYRVMKIARRRGLAAQQLTAPDLMDRFCELARQRGYSSYFYGDTEETLGKLMESLTSKHPGLKIAGTLSPPFRPLSPSEEASLIERVNQARPDVLWVGLGLPKQERWIARNLKSLRVPVIAAVGATFKFHSGVVPRAPEFLVRNGFEWAWRLAHEPRRLFRRYVLMGPPFLWNVALERYGLRTYDCGDANSGQTR
jgi:N-acetylglucosaminyldiphosphoundecaprenol N-acetyl-beta-D-mannosaminyltransferase